MVVADEWDIDQGTAWYLSAGAVYPTLSIWMVTRSDELGPSRYRFAWSIAGTGFGVTLAGIGAVNSDITVGDAALAHSGGVLGLAVGGLGDFLVHGKTNFTPLGGMGYGTGVGALAAGLAGTFVSLSATEVLWLDLGAGLGGLGGAALSSPLALGESTERERRLWLGSILLGMAGGALTGVWLADADADAEDEPVSFLPYVTVLPARVSTRAPPRSPGDARAALEGPLVFGVQGTF
jgi:hypothetical protein